MKFVIKNTKIKNKKINKINKLRINNKNFQYKISINKIKLKITMNLVILLPKIKIYKNKIH